MNKNELCKLVSCATESLPDFECSAVTEDSRRVQPGSVFVAVAGEHADGHVYVDDATQRGAAAILGNKRDLRELHGVPYIFCEDPRQAAGLLAHALAGNPSRDMTVIGITGTNGKSSTAYLTQRVLMEAGFSAANFGTMGYHFPGESLPALHTTPFGEDLAALFKRARERNISHVAMEVSSHALDQERIAGIDFDVAAFTNLTQDHLDYHKDMGAYRDAKLKLFARIPRDRGFTVVNAADPAAPEFIAASNARCYTYGKGGDCKAKRIEQSFGGAQFHLKSPWGKAEVRLNLLGKHNVYNALCAATICGGLGIDIDTIARGLGALERVPGRFEAVDAGQDFYVVVDYAHTEDGLLNVLKAARKLCRGRIIAVFGCGGDRDKGKRPKMGAVAATHSDFAIVTSDNPRTEDPHRILLDVEMGVQRAGKQKGDGYTVIENRAEAIRTAIKMAKRGDLVMIAGKGHEDYQILGTTRIHFDDRETARNILNER
ncbi:MAG: UDP-N-acetylmuramoyl-L-alanyl-D-glutamate--2,6-diaminopimelate ligase [Candidatus Hydrogenedentes bacterium]|nr:UDP-N-acetylmuramoyl-L-alanyl-D-glutamate--2,6-diaminopimelate ligase [Candidatus Hydrogenedentota bacterium]